MRRNWVLAAAYICASALTIPNLPVSAATVGYSEAAQAFDDNSTVSDRISTQIRLIAAGYSNGVPTEHFSKRLFDSVRAFQSANDFGANGQLNGMQLQRLTAESNVRLDQWGFRTVTFPTRPIAIWVPLGLKLSASTRPHGMLYTDPEGRLELDLLSYPALRAENAYKGSLDDWSRKGWTIHYSVLKAGEGWFVVSATSPDGHDHYYRYHQDGAAVTGFALEWDNTAGNINAERIAVIMSGSLLSAMTGTPFVDPSSFAPTSNFLRAEAALKAQAQRQDELREIETAREEARSEEHDRQVDIARQAERDRAAERQRQTERDQVADRQRQDEQDRQRRDAERLRPQIVVNLVNPAAQVEKQVQATQPAQPTLQAAATAPQLGKEDAERINKSIGELGAQVKALRGALDEQKKLKAASDGDVVTIDQTIILVQQQLEARQSEYDTAQRQFSTYLTSIRPEDRQLYMTARAATQAFPRVPYYIPGTPETGEFWIEPVVSDGGVLTFQLRFVDPRADYNQVRETISMSSSEIAETQAALTKIRAWSQKAHESGLRKIYSKRAACFPQANCPADGAAIDGAASTEIRFNVYEDGSTGGRIQRNKGRFVEGYNVSMDSALLLGAYIAYARTAANREFTQGTQTKQDLDKMFQ